MHNLTPVPVQLVPLVPLVSLVPSQDVHESRVLGLLHAGIPLTLLVDLAAPAGPDSAAIYADEAGDAAWLTA